ncbi:alpha/beta fold hydrolase [Streptomyces aureus]
MEGRHSLARHVDDLAELLDAWDVAKAVLIGHSYGTDLASRFCLTHPARVAAMLLMCGPFVGDWRTGTGRSEIAVCPQHSGSGSIYWSRCRTALRSRKSSCLR